MVKVARVGPDESSIPTLIDIIDLNQNAKVKPLANEKSVSVHDVQSTKTTNLVQPINLNLVGDQATLRESAKPEIKTLEKPKESGQTKKDSDTAKDNIFSNLFSKNEIEEETPLDRLIKTLPNVALEDVRKQSEEVNELMNEWFLSPKC